MELFLCIAIALLALFFWTAITTTYRPRGFPPGPRPLPFIGSIHHVTPNSNIKLPLLHQKFGKIVGFIFNHRKIISVSGLKAINEVMIVNPKPFSSRPVAVTSSLRGKYLDGIVSAPYGVKWAAHRKLFHTALRSMGLNNKGFEAIIGEELPYFIEKLDEISQSDQFVEPSEALEYAVLNVLSYFTFGNRYSYGDEKFKVLLKENKFFFEKITHLVNVGFLFAVFVPFLNKIWMPKSSREVKESCIKIKDFIKSEIRYHKDTIDQKHPRDLIDYYLIKMQSRNSNLYTNDGLEMTIFDLFQAGTETISTTLKWAVLFMVNNPDIQEKVHAEITKAVGTANYPTYEDKLLMPYTEAAILEVQRVANIIPLGLSHMTTEDCQAAGYNISKGTTVVACYNSIHHSSEHWKNADRFDPENFLDPNGKVGTRNAFMPYGGGLRICLGMNIAKQEIFVFFAAMMQVFKFSTPDGILKFSEVPCGGLALQPKPYKVKITRRL